jgi:hypothetical protein
MKTLVARNNRLILSAMLLSIFAGSAAAQLSGEEVARLDKDLTPMGAERAGNAAGTIPAWDGGITQPPAGFDPAKGYANPFADD